MIRLRGDVLAFCLPTRSLGSPRDTVLAPAGVIRVGRDVIGPTRSTSNAFEVDGNQRSAKASTPKETAMNCRISFRGCVRAWAFAHLTTTRFPRQPCIRIFCPSRHVSLSFGKALRFRNHSLFPDGTRHSFAESQPSETSPHFPSEYACHA
jgi:hypothetical protein